MTNRTLVIACVAAGVTLTGCGAFQNQRGLGDAPVQQVEKRTWQVIPAPNDYGNIATICNPVQKGTRIYVVTHGKTDVQPVIMVDESCR
jgi:hypothetical protein